MREIYKDKIAKMGEGDRKLVAEFFARNEGEVITAEDIRKAVGFQLVPRSIVCALRSYGWVIENMAENGTPAKWVCIGVSCEKKPRNFMPRPRLNPLIEAVFC